MNKIIILIITHFLFTTLVYSEPIASYNYLRVPLKYANGGAVLKMMNANFANL